MKRSFLILLILLCMIGVFEMSILGNPNNLQKRMVDQINYRINVVNGIVASKNPNDTFNCYIAGETVIYPNIPTFSRNPKLGPGDKVVIEFINGCRETPAILAPEDIREQPETTIIEPEIVMFENQLVYVLTSYTNMTSSTKREGMPILAISDHQVTQVHIVAKKYGNPGNVNVEIYAADINKYPTGPVLSSGSFDGDTLLEVPGWQEIDVSECSFVNGEWYVIVFNVPAAGSYNYFRWYGTFANVYPNAKEIYSYNSGVNWYTGIADFSFKVYGY